MTELKNCPGCGSDRIKVSNEDWKYIYAECLGCGKSTRPFFVDKYDDAVGTVVHAWNQKRVPRRLKRYKKIHKAIYGDGNENT
jgi:hypothetical protein